MPSKAVLAGAPFADYRQATGKLVYYSYVYVKNRPVRACDHEHRKASAAKACANRMLAAYLSEQEGPEMQGKPLYKEVITFCRGHLGKHCFAPLTGQDWSAWIAFVYLVEMYARGDANGRAAALDAMREILRGGCQDTETIHQLFVQAIPAVMDWCHADEIWSQVQGNWNVRPVRVD